mgnify:CR=1 FL=1
MLYRIIAWIFSRNPNYLSILKKSELGVYFFCRKVAIEADKNGYTKLASILEKQAESEYNHAQAFGNLLSEKLPESYKKLVSRGHRTLNWTLIGSAEGKYNATNLSQHPLARIFFSDKPAESYSLFNKVAFMQVLEAHQVRFYKSLAKFVEPQVSIVLHSILKEEENHASALEYEFFQMMDYKYACRYLNKWQYRGFIALLKLPCLIKSL